MARSQTAIPALLENFTYKKLTALQPGQQPTHAFINTVELQTVKNTTSVTARHAPVSGTSSAVLSQARYDTFFPGQNCDVPQNPGPFDINNGPAGQGAAHKTNRIREPSLGTRDWFR